MSILKSTPNCENCKKNFKLIKLFSAPAGEFNQDRIEGIIEDIKLTTAKFYEIISVYTKTYRAQKIGFNKPRIDFEIYYCPACFDGWLDIKTITRKNIFGIFYEDGKQEREVHYHNDAIKGIVEKHK